MRPAGQRADDQTTQWGVVGGALMAGLIAAGHVGKLPPALPAIRADLDLDLMTAGWLASMFSATGVLIAGLVGAVADRFDHWRLAVVGLAVMAASGFVGALTQTAPQMIASRFFEGVGFLAVVVAAPAVVAQATSNRDRQMALGFWPAYMPGGASIMIAVAPFLLSTGGWRGLWIVVAMLAAAAAVAMLLSGSPPSPRCPALPRPWTGIRLALAQQGPWLLAACFVLYGSQLYAIITWMPTFMMDERGASPAMAATLTAVVVAVNGLCNVLGGIVLHRRVPPWAVIVAAGVVMALGAGATFSASLPDLARYASSVVLCGAGGMVASATFAAVPEFALSPAQSGAINGILVQASSVAQFAGPSALAAGVARSGRWESAVWVMVGANMLMIVLALLLRRQQSLWSA
jgi:DHA1 family inner membrane transport protein